MIKVGSLFFSLQIWEESSCQVFRSGGCWISLRIERVCFPGLIFSLFVRIICFGKQISRIGFFEDCSGKTQEVRAFYLVCQKNLDFRWSYIESNTKSRDLLQMAPFSSILVPCETGFDGYLSSCLPSYQK